jgi:hypothetical protein
MSRSYNLPQNASVAYSGTALAFIQNIFISFCLKLYVTLNVIISLSLSYVYLDISDTTYNAFSLHST